MIGDRAIISISHHVHLHISYASKDGMTAASERMAKKGRSCDFYKIHVTPRSQS
mgnify:CR=1 FL=1